MEDRVMLGSGAPLCEGGGSTNKHNPAPRGSEKRGGGKRLPQAVDPPLTQVEVWACQPALRPLLPGTLTLRTPMLPEPGVETPFTTIEAPVGTWFSPSWLPTAMNTL